MAAVKHPTYKSWSQIVSAFVITLVGTCLAALALDAFLIPYRVIDGGIVGLALLAGALTTKQMMPIFFCLFNLPFIYMAYRSIGRTFVVQMVSAALMFSGWVLLFDHWHFFEFHGDMLEVIVIGGLLLGIGVGMVIRAGGCIDGTEILAIIINRQYGFTVGQTVLACNVVIFSAAGVVFGDWHSAIYSFMTFIVVIQIMDKVIVGLDETKSVTIISAEPERVTQAILHDLGLGLTVMYGRGGFTGKEQEILYVITERLQLGALKEVVYREDPTAFMAVSTLHEIAAGVEGYEIHRAKARKRT